MQTTEERTPTMSPEERKEKQRRWNQLEAHRKSVEERKETLLGIMGTIKHWVPEQTRSYWESQRSPEPQWAARLAELRETKSQLLYEEKGLGSTPETPYSPDMDYADEIARVKRKLEKHLAKKPPSSRPLALLEKEKARLEEWFKRHEEWTDSMEHHASEIKIVGLGKAYAEEAYEEWATLSPAPLPVEVKPTSVKPAEDWRHALETYSDLLQQYQQYQTLDAVHSKQNWNVWCAEKAEYDQWVEEAQTNDWNDKELLEKNLKDTRQYIETRQQLARETERLAAQRLEYQETLQRHGDWKDSYNCWLTERHAIPEGETLESIESQIAALRRLETIQNDPWWNEYNDWKKKQERCKKHGWLSVASVKAELADYEEEKQRFQQNKRQLERLVKEKDEFVKSNPHADCAVCQTRIADLDARMNECTESIGEWTLEKLDSFILYYQKALTNIQYVETLQASMEAMHQRQEAETQRLNKTLANPALTVAELEERKALHRRVQEGEKHRWLHELEEKYAHIHKQWKKSAQRLAAMQTDETLMETEGYWKHALDICSKIAYKQSFIERETKAWEAAKASWEAHPEVSAETLADAWGLAESSWRTAGERLKARRDELDSKKRALEAFPRELAEYTSQRKLLATEMEWAAATAEWNDRTERLESQLDDLRAAQWACAYHTCLRELETYEGYELAEKWLQWYAFADLQTEYTAIQAEQMELRDSLRLVGGACGAGGGDDDGDGDEGDAYTYLKKLATDWEKRLRALTVMDIYLVGEKGKKKKDMEDIDTFKEWIYQHHALPVLEEYVNEFLQSIGVDLTLRMVYGKRAIKYMVRDRGNETSFAASSGFQQFVIGLGMRHALSNIGGTGNNMQHLFIDEGFTACDVENVEKAYEILNVLIQKGHYKSILLISHLDTIQQMVSLKIPLERKDNFTKLAYGEPYPVFASTVKRRGRPPKK
jgi:hypothetical protein